MLPVIGMILITPLPGHTQPRPLSIREALSLVQTQQPQLQAYKERTTAAGFNSSLARNTLVPDLTVEVNILLPAWTTRPQDATARLQATYDVIPELRSLAKRRTTQLSGGQQKIVALARAITGGTRLLLLDEPLEGVAPALAERICDVIGGLKRLGVSALVAESDTKGLTRALDRVYVIERGTISAG